jgi:hypothetical protein
VVRERVSGAICRSVEEMASKARDALTVYRPAEVRAYTAQNFSREVMAGKYAATYSELIRGEAATVSGKAAATPLAA